MNELTYIEGLITEVKYLHHEKTGPYAKLTVDGQEQWTVIIKGVEEKDNTPFYNSYGSFQGVVKEVKGETLLISDNEWTIDPGAVEPELSGEDAFLKDKEVARLASVMAECLNEGRILDQQNWLAIGLAIFNKYKGIQQ